jgi:hypothetical protein
MVASVLSFAPTVPAGTAKASPVVVNLAVGTNVIDIIRWRVPPGPRGNLGWFLSMGGVQVIPQNVGNYIIADNEADDWQIAGLPDSGAWQLTGYNTGVYDHTVYLDFHVTPVSSGTTTGGDIMAGFPTSEADIPTMWTL